MEKFLWGLSTSAYQFEGESQSSSKGLSIQDVRNPKGDIKVASDHYHHYKEDVQLMKELGINCYRFSISWTRILPKGYGKVNEEGLQFYRNLIHLLVENEITPIIVLYHDDFPYNLYKKGEWYNRDNIYRFQKYCEILFKEFKDVFAYWVPICEQNVLTIEEIVKESKSLKEVMQRNHHMFLANALAVQSFKKIKGKGKIGPLPNLVEVYPISSNPKDIRASYEMGLLRQWMYLDVYFKGHYSEVCKSLLQQLSCWVDFQQDDEEILKEGRCDFLAFSCYTSLTVKHSRINTYKDHTKMKYGFNIPNHFEIIKNPYLGETKFAFEYDPEGFSLLLEELTQRYDVDLLATFRGLGLKEKIEQGSVKDDQRIEYLKLQLSQIQKAKNNGARIIGFTTWSGFDLVSTSNGYQSRYGLIYVDRDDENPNDCQRIPKKSYYFFKDWIMNHPYGI